MARISFARKDVLTRSEQDLLLNVDVGTLGRSIHLDYASCSSGRRGILSRNLATHAPAGALLDCVKRSRCV